MINDMKDRGSKEQEIHEIITRLEQMKIFLVYFRSWIPVYSFSFKNDPGRDSRETWRSTWFYDFFHWYMLKPFKYSSGQAFLKFPEIKTSL